MRELDLGCRVSGVRVEGVGLGGKLASFLL